MTEEVVQEIGDKIVGVLKTIYDPEIPVDIYELGLIYDVFVNEKNEAKIFQCPKNIEKQDSQSTKTQEIEGVIEMSLTFCFKIRLIFFLQKPFLNDYKNISLSNKR